MPGWALAAAVIAALVPAAVVGAHRVLDGSTSPAAHSTDLPIPPVSPRTTAPATTPSSQPSSPQTTVRALPRIDPDAPRRIQSGAVLDAGFDDAVTALEPASTSEVARLGSRGSPGSPGTDTVYVVGTMRTGGAFADLAELATGSTVVLRTDSGTMTYTVGATGLQSAAGLAQDPLFTARTPGRLVLVGIRYAASGDRLPDALVVTAQLSAAEKT